MSKAELIKNLARARKRYDEAAKYMKAVDVQGAGQEANVKARQKALESYNLAQDELAAILAELEQQEDVLEELVEIKGYRPRSSRVSHLEKDLPTGRSFAQAAIKRG